MLLLACVLLPLAVFGQTTLNGAGATFPYPIYSKWFSEYHKVHSDVQINYQSIGSGGGIRQVTEATVEFGASDMPMTDDQLKEAGAKLKTKVLNIPTVLGAVVPVYNVPGVTGEVKFTPDVLAEIFLGRITNWSDKAISAANPDLKFPNQEIIVVHRSDGSGTTFIWTDSTSKVSPDWKSQVGSGTSVKWPTGLGGQGNEGVAGSVRQLAGSIGYVELIYAVQNKIPYGSGEKFLRSLPEGFSGRRDRGGGFGSEDACRFPRVSITNAPGKEAYPISSFTWLLIPSQSKDPAKGKILADFLSWMVAEGQTMTSALAYAPLPENVATKVKEAIKQVK